MGYFAFKRLRAQEAAAEAAASTPEVEKTKPVNKNGSNNRRNSGRSKRKQLPDTE